MTLWAQLYWICVPAWLHGDYYSYGWYVPPLLLLMMWRLRPLWLKAAIKPTPPMIFGAALAILLVLLIALRVLNRVDPRWTLPIWAQAGLVVGLTLWFAHRAGGGRAVRRLIPVFLFACTAIPLPSALERLVVSTLTQSVIGTTARFLGMIDRPVLAVGDQLGRMGQVIQVTEGCSGIRSAQTFLMAALFFGEWMELKMGGRWLMVAAGVVTAWSLNVLRASGLAWIRFERGEDAFSATHDLAGFLAFAAGSGILLWISSALDTRTAFRRTRRRTTEELPS